MTYCLETNCITYFPVLLFIEITQSPNMANNFTTWIEMKWEWEKRKNLRDSGNWITHLLCNNILLIHASFIWKERCISNSIKNWETINLRFHLLQLLSFNNCIFISTRKNSIIGSRCNLSQIICLQNFFLSYIELNQQIS